MNLQICTSKITSFSFNNYFIVVFILRKYIGLIELRAFYVNLTIFNSNLKTLFQSCCDLLIRKKTKKGQILKIFCLFIS